MPFRCFAKLSVDLNLMRTLRNGRDCWRMEGGCGLAQPPSTWVYPLAFLPFGSFGGSASDGFLSPSTSCCFGPSVTAEMR